MSDSTLIIEGEIKQLTFKVDYMEKKWKSKKYKIVDVL
jgi:hypothetical protein